MKKEILKSLQEGIGYSFQNEEMLEQAISHSSYVNEKQINKGESYERTEFLGDAVLEFIVSKYLFKQYPDKNEGDLTKLRASLVCEATLSTLAREMKFGEYVFLSKGEESTGGRNRNSILCDLFEAVLGAIYIDGGMKEAEKFVERFLLKDIEHQSLFYDAKTSLQEIAVKGGYGEIRYELVKEDGPAHEKTYEAQVLIDEKVFASGTGQSKKAAEQTAAYEAILILQNSLILN